MRRALQTIFALALATGFCACEQHSVATLPPHYQHKLHGHHDDSHASKKKDHTAHPTPAAGEKKAN